MHSATRTVVRHAFPGPYVPSPPQVKAEVTAVLHRSAQVLLDGLPELTDRVLALIHKYEPAYRTAYPDEDGLWQEVHESLRYSVGSLIRHRELRQDAHGSSRRIGAAGPERGLPLDAVLHAFRLGGSVVWEELVGVAARRDPHSMRVLVHVAADVWEFVDEHCAVVAEAYRAAERELSWRRTNRWQLTVEALLEGRTRVAELPDVAAALGLPVHGRFAVGAVAGPGRGALRERVSERASAPGSGAPGPGAGAGPGRAPAPYPGGLLLLWHPSGGGGGPGQGQGRGQGSGGSTGGAAVDFVIASLGDRSERTLAEALRAAVRRPGPGGAPPPRVRIGVGPGVTGLAEVGQARRMAETALRTCAESADGADGEVALLDEVLPSALAVSCPDLTAVLLERMLGPVLRVEPSGGALLLDTLRTWLACDGSAQRAAVRLHCHRNTVLNRLRRYEKLTGHRLDTSRTTVELSLALTALRLAPHGS